VEVIFWSPTRTVFGYVPFRWTFLLANSPSKLILRGKTGQGSEMGPRVVKLAKVSDRIHKCVSRCGAALKRWNETMGSRWKLLKGDRKCAMHRFKSVTQKPSTLVSDILLVEGH
jgi:hypothetical protein